MQIGIDRTMLSQFKSWKLLRFREVCTGRSVREHRSSRGVGRSHYRVATSNKPALKRGFDVTPRGCTQRITYRRRARRCTRTMCKLRVHKAPLCEIASSRVKATMFRAIWSASSRSLAHTHNIHTHTYTHAPLALIPRCRGSVALCKRVSVVVNIKFSAGATTLADVSTREILLALNLATYYICAVMNIARF